MTLFRLISPALRSGLMIATGTALMVLPPVLGMSAAAIVTGVAIGVLAGALGVAGTATEGRGTLPLSAHAAYDRGLAIGLFAVAILFGTAGEPAALAFFSAAGAAQLLLGISTRYSGGRAIST
jgi:hypothetical protein